MDSHTTSQPKHGDSSPTIVIPPPNVEMTDNIDHILYLSSSLSSLLKNLPKVSTHASIEPILIESQVSTSIDPPSTSSSSTIQYYVYVNLISQVDKPNNVNASCIQSSSHLRISKPDEDNMEAMSTPDYPYT